MTTSETTEATCECGAGCTCGCQDGKPCQCSKDSD
jgi:hypothetical protein